MGLKPATSRPRVWHFTTAPLGTPAVINSTKGPSILASTKLKAFADNKFNSASPFTKWQDFRQVQIESICRRQIAVNHMEKIVLNKIDNIVGKRENADYQHFLLFPQCFRKAFSLWPLKNGFVW